MESQPDKPEETLKPMSQAGVGVVPLGLHQLAATKMVLVPSRWLREVHLVERPDAPKRARRTVLWVLLLFCADLCVLFCFCFFGFSWFLLNWYLNGVKGNNEE